jgi:hypothetical protein
VDILIIIQAYTAGNLDITTIMQPALAFRQLDISIEIQLAQNFKRNTDIRNNIAYAKVKEIGYIETSITCVDIQGLETFNNITINTIISLPGYIL